MLLYKKITTKISLNATEYSFTDKQNNRLDTQLYQIIIFNSKRYIHIHTDANIWNYRVLLLKMRQLFLKTS